VTLLRLGSTAPVAGACKIAPLQRSASPTVSRSRQWASHSSSVQNGPPAWNRSRRAASRQHSSLLAPARPASVPRSVEAVPPLARAPLFPSRLLAFFTRSVPAALFTPEGDRPFLRHRRATARDLPSSQRRCEPCLPLSSDQ
jgi:hypothetical protein